MQCSGGEPLFGADEFGPDFQRVLIRACLDDPNLRGLVSRFTGVGQLGFTDPAAQWAWAILGQTDRPTMLQLRTEARRIDPADPAWSGVQAILHTADVRDHEYVSTQIVEWSRRQVFRNAFEEARSAWNNGDFDLAQTRMMTRLEELSQITMDVADRGWFFEEFDQRQARRQVVAAGDDVFPTGVDRLDRALYGGLSYGELGVAVAYSKVGKTFWLIQQGFIGARMRRRVLHFPLEGGRAKTEDRYETRFLRSLYRDIRRGDADPEMLAHARREYAILHRNLVVRGVGDLKEWSANVDFLLGEVNHLREVEGWVPDLIIVDYGDLLDAPGDNDRAKQKEAFRRLKALAERKGSGHPYGFAVWTASQAVRPTKGADEREHVVKPRDIADCYEKVRVADLILSLNRTNREKKHNRARVFLGAYRDAVDGALIRVETDYDHGAFSVLGAKEPPPLPKKGKGQEDD